MALTLREGSLSDLCSVAIKWESISFCIEQTIESANLP